MPEQNNKKNKAYIVTHTHWDREWRYPIWENRMKLVEFMDELLEILDTDPDYKTFVLDGQSVVIEDYLEVRPYRKEKIMKYIKEGRLSIGPWYTLPDLYPIDGECLIRNLLKGIRYSDSLGGHLKIAYESFGWGQTAQFPQIYKGFGLDFVVVAKNVSKERAPESEFIWEGPDGTKVLATRLGQNARANFFMNAYIPIMYGMQYLSDDYKFKWGQMGAVYHQADGNNFYKDYVKTENTGRIHEELLRDGVKAAWDAAGETTVKSHRILMDGSDSTTAQPMLTSVIKKANELFDDIEFTHSTLGEYADALKGLVDYDNLKVVKGELRDGPASSCSANALATRPSNKILNKKVQNSLLHSAEPLSSAGCMIGLQYDKYFIDKALKYMLLSHPHDSINGVTQDKTADDVCYMLNQSLEISEVINNTVCRGLISKIDMGSFNADDIILVAVNPASRERREIVKVFLDMPREFNIWDFDILDDEGNKVETQFISRQEELIPVDDIHSRPWPFYADRHSLYVDTGVMPAGGYKVFKVVPNKSYNRKAVFWPDMRMSTGEYIAKSSNIMENEFLRAKVQYNGTLSIFDKETGKWYENLNYFEDTGDCGDYWMYYPPYNNKTLTSLGCQSRIWMEDNGPLTATIAAEIKMMLPAYAFRPENGVIGESRRSDEEKELTAVVYYSLKRGSKKVDVKLKVDNNVEDHRLRVMFDTGIKAEFSDAAGHFTVDRRSVAPHKDNNGKYYPEMQTLPQQYFVDISDGKCGFAVINNCFTEFEAIDNDEGTLAITLFRGVRNIICTEFRSAGVFPQQKGGQSLGTLEYEYAIYTHKGYWDDADVYDEAERFNIPLRLAQTCKHDGGALPQKLSLFSVKPSNLIMSAFKKAEDRDSLIMRLFNPTDETLKGKITLYSPIKEAHLTNLNEERQKELEISEGHSICLDVGHKKIVTVEIAL